MKEDINEMEYGVVASSVPNFGRQYFPTTMRMLMTYFAPPLFCNDNNNENRGWPNKVRCFALFSYHDYEWLRTLGYAIICLFLLLCVYII